MNLKILIFCFIFLLGFLSCAFIFYISDLSIEKPFASRILENTAPSDWIKENQVHFYENAVVIDVKNASLSHYADTGSMKPVLDKDSNGIRIIPENEEQIKVGDIVTFEKGEDLIVHRVIEKGKDEQGIYFITKGDNAESEDGKIRFNQIKYVTIAVLW